MIDVASGFRIGDALFPWGTRIDDVRSACRVDHVKASTQVLEVACTRTYGFDTFMARVIGAGPESALITSIEYAIATVYRDMPDRWVDLLSAAHGPAQNDDTHNETDASGVRRYVAWEIGNHRISLSIYGAPRLESRTYSAGCLWLEWTPTAAENPFLPDWQRRTELLTSLSTAYTDIMVFTTVERRHPVIEEDDGDTAAQVRRLSDAVLHRPEVLPTPPAIAEHLGSNDFAFWRTPTHWCLSTHRDSICFAIAESVTVTHYDFRPATGPGYQGISINGWFVIDNYHSNAIIDAIATLRALPRVRIDIARDDDY